MQRGEWYQSVLIAFGVITTILFGVFFYRELFPEYLIYQNDYIALENFRSSYTNEAPPEFKKGVKQIVMERDDKGPAVIDRCITCHVALQIEDFSPTIVARDAAGHIVYDEAGFPKKEENPRYIWKKLDEAIQTTQDSAKKVEWEALKTATVGEFTYDMTKVLAMHPLIGRETRPFELHPIEDYGCVSCHGGNGRGLVTDRAHGPVFDGQYEKESVGFVPQFLEKDAKNDPSFAHVFNSKPGHRLLFQTNPLYVGALIQAKCMQCHQSSEDALEGAKNTAAFVMRQFQKTLALDNKKAGSSSEKAALASYEEELLKHFANPSSAKPVGKLKTDVDLLTKDYQRGQALFLSQGCYACHRIDGYSRGGVGPELTRSGESYPWFVKESIVWPQADLKTSTMPNLRLDHEEVEALLTYLLAQTGKNKNISDMSRKISLQEWELGKKQPWEMPVEKREIHDVRYGMRVFALEGCASCHRLQGYESDAAFASPDANSWFESQFPENISSTQLVAAIEKNSQEIDQKIKDHAKEGSLLEEIEKERPDAVESLYSNFKYALRAKNHLGEAVAKPWKEKVRRVLKMFVETYGLGRLICPKLNWSGVYRSDQWLFEHFKAPTSLVPRSIMPVFPFDDTKFYALTEMLDQLAKKNIERERKVVQSSEFSPEAAYQHYCSECHGTYLEGNGVIAEWIYPIPKNLKDPEFMRNLGKEQVIRSITHGVKGTPMPPWGELGEGKSFDNKQPVMSKEEIKSLVDWLFANLPGGTVIRSDKEVPKWNYSPEDVMKELENSVFDPAREPEHFIQKKYYTAENIEAGRRFFITNCAPCHGNEADGSGIRAEAMSDAKPRMLTNRDWLESHDDLRLLRSIKYGVAGTSMTPWGDLTSPLQRLQLVVFIRSLSGEIPK